MRVLDTTAETPPRRVPGDAIERPYRSRRHSSSIVEIDDEHGVPGAVAELMVPKDRRILEGKCHVQAPLGGFRCFQIRVHDPAKREAIFQTLLDRLQEIGMLAGARDREA